jgi:hypothetical protein
MFANAVVIGLLGLALNALLFLPSRLSAVAPLSGIGRNANGLREPWFRVFLRLAAANLPPLRGFLPSWRFW